jgi:NADPH:quinone reductase
MNINMRAAAIRGCIFNIGRLGRGKAEFDFDAYAQRRITYIGVVHRTRSVKELREEMRAMQADLADAVRGKKLRLPIEKTYSLEQARAAQEHMRGQAAF